MTCTLVLGFASACSDDGGPETTDPGVTEPGTSEGPADGNDGDPESAGPPFAVGRRNLTLVDETRGTDAVADQGLEEQPDRTVDVIVIYPATGEPGEPASVAAAWDHTGGEYPDRVATLDAEAATGPFPLVVFAHGASGQGSSFVPVAEQWARAGYVVALPTFPLSRNGIGANSDYVNQPGDLAFVVDELVAADDDDPLAGLVDAEQLAVAGHSLGSATVFRGAYNSCCVDDRIDATIAASGGPLDLTEPGNADGYTDQPDTPMLLVHGAADPLVPVSVGDAMFDFVTAPVTYLRLDDADHVSVFTGEDGELFSAAALAFLDAHLRDDPDALAALPDRVADSGLGELRTRQTED